MLKYFDPRGQMGRKAYFISYLVRLLLLCIATFIVMFVILVAGFLFAHPGPIEEYAFDQNPVVRFVDQYTYVFAGPVAFIVFAPISVRRANDIRLDLKWLVPGWIFSILPVAWMSESLSRTGPGLGLLVLFVVYNWVIKLILLFKPGEVYRQWARKGTA